MVKSVKSLFVIFAIFFLIAFASAQQGIPGQPIEQIDSPNFGSYSLPSYYYVFNSVDCNTLGPIIGHPIQEKLLCNIAKNGIASTVTTNSEEANQLIVEYRNFKMPREITWDYINSRQFQTDLFNQIGQILPGQLLKDFVSAISYRAYQIWDNSPDPSQRIDIEPCIDLIQTALTYDNDDSIWRDTPIDEKKFTYYPENSICGAYTCLGGLNGEGNYDDCYDFGMTDQSGAVVREYRATCASETECYQNPTFIKRCVPVPGSITTKGTPVMQCKYPGQLDPTFYKQNKQEVFIGDCNKGLHYDQFCFRCENGGFELKENPKTVTEAGSNDRVSTTTVYDVQGLIFATGLAEDSQSNQYFTLNGKSCTSADRELYFRGKSCGECYKDQQEEIPSRLRYGIIPDGKKCCTYSIGNYKEIKFTDIMDQSKIQDYTQNGPNKNSGYSSYAKNFYASSLLSLDNYNKWYVAATQTYYNGIDPNLNFNLYGNLFLYPIETPACAGETPKTSFDMPDATCDAVPQASSDSGLITDSNCLEPQAINACFLKDFNFNFNGITAFMDNGQVLSVVSTINNDPPPITQVAGISVVQVRTKQDFINLVYKENSPLYQRKDELVNAFGGFGDPNAVIADAGCMAIGGKWVETSKRLCLRADQTLAGSCPFLYSKTNEGYKLEEDIFPGQTEEFMSNPYYTKLKNFDPNNLKFLVYEHLDETSYIDQAELITVEHPEGTEVMSDVLGRFYTIKSPESVFCIDDKGIDCTKMLANQDAEIKSDSRTTKFGMLENTHEIAEASFGKEAWAQATSDDTVGYMELELPETEAKQAKLIVGFSRNSKKVIPDKPELKKDILKEVLSNIDYFAKRYKEEYKDKYQRNVIIQYLDKGVWKTYPLQDDYNIHTEVYKIVVIPIDLSIVKENKIRILQRSVYAFDYIAVDYSEDEIISVDRQKPTNIKNLEFADDSESILKKDDYLELSFEPRQTKNKQSYFFMSKGYYVGDEK